MKYLFIILCLLCSHIAHADNYVLKTVLPANSTGSAYVYSSALTVPDGYQFKLIGATSIYGIYPRTDSDVWLGSSDYGLRVKFGDSAWLPLFNGGTGERVESMKSLTGPLEIRVKYRVDNSQPEQEAQMIYSLTPTSVASAPSQGPSNTVVIPTNATGDVEIIMESSTDLVNWTSANLGTYSSDESNRFFRIRAVTQ